MSSQFSTMIFLNQIQPHKTSRNIELNNFEQHTFLDDILIILTYVIYKIWCSALSPCLKKIKISIIQLFHFIQTKNFNLHCSQQRMSSTQCINNSISNSTLVLQNKFITLQVLNPLHMSLIKFMLTLQVL